MLQIKNKLSFLAISLVVFSIWSTSAHAESASPLPPTPSFPTYPPATPNSCHKEQCAARGKTAVSKQGTCQYDRYERVLSSIYNTYIYYSQVITGTPNTLYTVACRVYMSCRPALAQASKCNSLVQQSATCLPYLPEVKPASNLLPLFYVSFSQATSSGLTRGDLLQICADAALSHTSVDFCNTLPSPIPSNGGYSFICCQ